MHRTTNGFRAVASKTGSAAFQLPLTAQFQSLPMLVPVVLTRLLSVSARSKQYSPSSIRQAAWARAEFFSRATMTWAYRNASDRATSSA